MSAATIWALLIFLLPLAWSPGPGNMAFAAAGAQVGLRGAIPALSGYHLATLVATAATGLTLERLTALLPLLLPVLRGLGLAYVLWLAWKLARAPAGLAGAAAVLTLRSGALLLVLNPKAWLIILAMFSQFPAAPLTTTLIFTANNLVAFVVWCLAGQALGRLCARPVAARALNRTLAALLAGSALAMALP